MAVNLSGLENELIRRGFEEDRRFYYGEFVNVSKEIVEKMKCGLIEDFAVVSADNSGSLEYVVYVKK